MAAPFPVSPQSLYVPSVFSKKLLAKFYKSTSLHMITNNDYEGEISGQGSKVVIRSTPTVAVADYTGTLSYETLGEANVELLIDQAKSYAFKDDDIFAAQRDIKDFVNKATQDAATNMKIAIEGDVFAAVYASAGSAIDAVTVPVTKLNVTDYIVDCGVKLDELNVSEEGRFIVIPSWMAGMIKKSDLGDASISGDGTSILRNGRLGIIDRFTIYVSNNLTADASDATNAPTVLDAYHCLAGTKEAITFATQFVKNRKVELIDTFGFAYSGLNVFGFNVVQPNALIDFRAKKGQSLIS